MFGKPSVLNCKQMAGDVRLAGFERITVNPLKCVGLPCIGSMRIRVIDVLELLGSKMPVEQILEEHPDLELEDLYECIRYAASVIPA